MKIRSLELKRTRLRIVLQTLKGCGVVAEPDSGNSSMGRPAYGSTLSESSTNWSVSLPTYLMEVMMRGCPMEMHQYRLSRKSYGVYHFLDHCGQNPAVFPTLISSRHNLLFLSGCPVQGIAVSRPGQQFRLHCPCTIKARSCPISPGGVYQKRTSR